jgi:hypothetical protein
MIRKKVDVSGTAAVRAVEQGGKGKVHSITGHEEPKRD